MPRVLSKRKGAERPPPSALYVGRPTRWGNPFKVQDNYSSRWDEIAAAHQVAVDQYREWCAPLPCHADVLLEIANAP